MKYKIRNAILPTKSLFTNNDIGNILSKTLDMYLKGEDITNSPFIASEEWKHHVFCYNAGNTLESALKRQEDIIKLFHSIKTNGYNGSTILVFFDDEGFPHLYDGFHRIGIMNYLGMDELVNVETEWKGLDESAGKDFPLAETLLHEWPYGKWVYQPIKDNRLKDFSVDRTDSQERLAHVLKGLVGETVLDIGCSEGYFSREIAKRGYKVTAIDSSKGLIATARYLSILEDVAVDYYHTGDWKDFLEKNGPYDNILFMCVIHNDMKVIGVEEGLKKLNVFKGKAKRVFFEAPTDSGREREWMVEGYPQFNFLKEESIARIEETLGMKATEMWSRKSGARPIFTFDNKSVDESRGKLKEEDLICSPNVNGSPMYLFRNERVITPYILKEHEWESSITKFIKDNLKEGQTFVDVGANIGYYSILASKLVGDKGRVFAFEPAPDCYQVLLKNIELNNCKNITPIRKASSSEAKQAKLFSYSGAGSTGERGLLTVQERGATWARRILPRLGLPGNHQLRESGWILVDTVRLDDVLDGAPDMIKIDVEGGGQQVLDGAKNIIKEGKTTLIVEDDGSKDAIVPGTNAERIKDRTGSSFFIFNNNKPKQPWWSLESWMLPERARCKPLFNTLMTKPCRNIMEIGTYNGNTAVVMIKAAAKKVPEEQIHYYGFDLFEGRTPEITKLEFSPVITTQIEAVKAHIERNTEAQVTLFKGNTHETLKEAVKTLPKMDLIYIDGGHTVETIRNDWQYSSMLMHKDTIAYFDDYDDEMPFFGSYFIPGELPPQYYSEVMSEVNYYKRQFGRFKSQLLKVELKHPEVIQVKKTPRYRFHLLGLAHSQTTKDWVMCPFTQLVYKMSQMMMDLGHEVIHYGTEGSNPLCTEHVDVLTRAVQKQAYGDWDPYKQLWVHNGNDLAYRTFRENAIKEIKLRVQPKDILLISIGNWYQPIANALPSLPAVEFCVGYLGMFSKYKVFPSYAWMHHLYGMQAKSNKENFATGNWYDAVIPHYFNPDDFKFQEKKDDYFLYIGRLITRKGVHILPDLCKRIGARLVVSGQPLYPDEPRKSKCLADLHLNQPHVEYLEPVSRERRNELMGKAKAVFIPSLYLEPFGKVVVESLLCGTPVITTDWGSFPEIVQHGEVGFRCRTMDDFTWAAKNIDRIDPHKCREYAVANYSMERISKMYQEYFMRIDDLFGKGWYAEHPERENLDWLRRY